MLLSILCSKALGLERTLLLWGTILLYMCYVYHLLHSLSVLWYFATSTIFVVKDEGTFWETTKMIHSVWFCHSGFPHVEFVQKIREQHHGSICRNAEFLKLPPSLSGNTLFLLSIEKGLTVGVFCPTHAVSVANRQQWVARIWIIKSE